MTHQSHSQTTAEDDTCQTPSSPGTDPPDQRFTRINRPGEERIRSTDCVYSSQTGKSAGNT